MAPMDALRLVRHLHPQHEVPGVSSRVARSHSIPSAQRNRNQRSRSMPYERGVNGELSLAISSLR